jgi:hypothetical protein
MMRFALFLTFFVVLFTTATFSAAEDDSVLGHREIVCVVEFALNSNNINASSRAAVNDVLQKLNQIDKKSYIIRIEGFARPNEGDCTILAFDRARAVDELLRYRHGNRGDRYLTGIVTTDITNTTEKSPYRAEIVIYDNLFSDAGEPELIYNKEPR